MYYGHGFWLSDFHVYQVYRTVSTADRRTQPIVERRKTLRTSAQVIG